MIYLHWMKYCLNITLSLNHIFLDYKMIDQHHFEETSCDEGFRQIKPKIKSETRLHTSDILLLKKDGI